ncbi:MAG: chromate efflux transporter [Acidimicrobiaceae bacterium]
MNNSTEKVSLSVIAKEWLRLGITGFGGPPAHIALLRKLCVEKNKWIESTEFEDAVATTNLMPGPASTQLAIFCAWKLRGVRGALLGGLCFIAPGLVIIIALAALFLAKHPMNWVLGAAGGAGAGVAVVALNAAYQLVPGSWQRFTSTQRARWFVYAILGVLCTNFLPAFVVLVLLACGLFEVMLRASDQRLGLMGPLALGHGAALTGMGAVCWVALKVGALSYGGGFVIIPLMQHDVVSTYHWMTNAQFLNAVALGQITPGPVAQTVAVVGYSARGLTGALLAAFIAFAPSFIFVLIGAPRFEKIRTNKNVASFFAGAGTAVLGAIAGASVPLTRALHHGWQIPLLLLMFVWVFLLRKGVVSGLLICGAVGIALSFLGLSV